MSLTYKSAAILDAQKILDEVDSTRFGLTQETALKRLGDIGPNTLPSKRATWQEVLLRQFKSAFIYMLLAAAAISFFVGDSKTDSIVILLIVLINTALGFIQEYRAENALELLKTFVDRKARVRRGGTEIIVSIKDIVPGDICILDAGDTLPADGYFLRAESAQVDESIMTGESKTVTKTTTPLASEPGDVYMATNIGFARTTLVAGNAEILVYATGAHTEVGSIVSHAQAMETTSAFEIEINNFSKLLLRLVLLLLPLLFVLDYFTHRESFDVVEFLLFFIALAVSAVPEALPLVTTIALSRGALLLAKKSVVPRRLSAIEDIGSIDILCTDKTGTITQNKMSVANFFGDENEVLRAALLVPLSHKGVQSIQNIAFDDALLARATKELIIDIDGVARIDELPFDPIRRRASCLVREGDIDTLIIRGGLESVSSTSTNKPTPEMLAWAKEQGERGMRVMAIARKSLHAGDVKELFGSHEADTTLLGAIAFEDPLKPSSIKAVAEARELGVTVKIITGDSAEVAGYVGIEAGIIASRDEVITGAELEKLTPNEKLAVVERCGVFARMMPLQKTEVINLLQNNHLVGFLGEGFNDTPALKAAHVGLTVSNASDMAQDAADIVLLDPSLDVITDGIKEGRKVFANSMKYLRSTLASTFGNSFTLALSSLFIPFLPMLPIQILVMNLISDFPMLTIATDNVDDAEVSKPRGYKAQDMIGIALLLGFVSSIFDFSTFGYFRQFAEDVGIVKGNPAILQTAWFIESILTELVLVFAIRTRLPFLRAMGPSKVLLFATAFTALITVALAYFPPARAIMHFIALKPEHISVVIGLVVVYFFVSEGFKLLYYKMKKSQ